MHLKDLLVLSYNILYYLTPFFPFLIRGRSACWVLKCSCRGTKIGRTCRGTKIGRCKNLFAFVLDFLETPVRTLTCL